MLPPSLPPDHHERTIEESPPPAWAGAESTGRGRTNWVAAIVYGLLVAIIGGILWGVILAFTGYIFALGALVLGIAVAWALRQGAGRVSPGLIVLAVVMTLGGVFVGDVVGLTLIANREGYAVSVVDVIGLYPEIMAFDPGRALIGYVFGTLGSAAAALRLYREMKGVSGPRYPTGVSSGSPAMVAGPAGVAVEVTARSATKAAARIQIAGSPSHTVEASYDATFGSAVVLLDGQRFQKARVWGYKKIMDVPIPGTPARRVSLKFYGAMAPRIDVSLDGTLLTTV